MVKLFKSQKPYEGELQILPWDQILSTEILNEAQEHLRETDDA